MAEGTFVSWLAIDNGEIIGTSGMSFVEKPPYFSCPSGKIGLLSSMYTNPKYRRMGIAKTSLDKVVNGQECMGVKLFKSLLQIWVASCIRVMGL